MRKRGAFGKEEKTVKAENPSELSDRVQHFSSNHGGPQSMSPDPTGNRAGLKLHLQNYKCNSCYRHITRCRDLLEAHP